MKKLYVFEGQSATARALMRAAGLHINDVTFIQVREADQLRGLDGGTFVMVQNHPRHLPAEIWQTVERNGMNVIVLSDEFARARAKERMRA